jgi:hypothetical protein
MEKSISKPTSVCEDPHKYVVGAYTDLKTAREAGKVEENWRHGQYRHRIHDFVLDHINTDKLKYIVCEENLNGQLSPDFEIINIKSAIRSE